MLNILICVLTLITASRSAAPAIEPCTKKEVLITAEFRYHWLKLYDDFFGSKRIKKLRKLAGGDTYTIIYLKMQLKAIKSAGVLKWTGLEEDFAAELALDLDESVDDVKITLNYLLSCGLAETSDGTNFFFPYAVANTGSETSAAKRMREMRERNNVTPLLRDRYGEIDKEKEKEIELESDIDQEGECERGKSSTPDKWTPEYIESIRERARRAFHGE